jgi:hypothetical protein
MGTDWVIKLLSRRTDRRYKYVRNTRNSHNAEYKRLKFCKTCKTIWEISTTGTTLHYSHLPTYGLTRKTCYHCKGIEKKTYKEKKKNETLF